MPFPRFSRSSRGLSAALTVAALSLSLGLSSCTSEQPETPVEQAVSLSVDPARITVRDTGADARPLTYRDVGEEGQSVTVEVAQGFDQRLMKADAVDVTAPAGGDVDTLYLPLVGVTVEAEEEDGESAEQGSRDVEFRLGRARAADLDLTDDIRSAEGFLLGWRATDSGKIPSVRLAAPKEATDEGRAIIEEALMKLLSLPVIFPEEPLGVGAAWSVDTRVTGESTLLQTTTYTVTGIDGDAVDLDVSVQQRPALGALRMEDGQSLNVLNSNTTSEGRLTVDLRNALPVDGRVSWTTRVVYGGADSDVRVIQDTTTSLAFTESQP